MSCNICKSALADGDKHFGCIRHRQCNRQAPCSLDIDEPAAFWDEVEDLLKAINVVSPERRTSCRVSAIYVDQVEGGTGSFQGIYRSTVRPLGGLWRGWDELSEVSDDKSSALGNEADLFRENAGQSDEEILDPSQQNLDTDAQEERDKTIFSKDRVNLILLSAAQLAGAEYLDNTESKSTLLFGHTGFKRNRASPILSMPPNVYEFRDQARSYSGSIGKRSYVMNWVQKMLHTEK